MLCGGRSLARAFVAGCLGCLTAAGARAQQVAGVVRDETGGALPGVAVELQREGSLPLTVVTDEAGAYRFESVPGLARVVFALVNFASARREVSVPDRGTVRADAVLHLSLSADVLVTGRRTFTNLADAEHPAEDLVGIAQSASQGAITARQLDVRPVMRAGEVLETVPGVIVSQHSGEGKANQYYLRGFNLDHGTDFATTVVGMPVNMPSHGHGQGYSDLNFLIPELVSGVQYAKGPYFADQGDFATAGSANINYVNGLDHPIVHVGGGGRGWGRALFAAATSAAGGRLLGALEAQHDDGPWARADDYRRLNGVVRFSRGDAVNGFSVTGMAYRAGWDSTDQIPRRALDQGLVGRFDAIDATDGGDTARVSGSFDWQRTRGTASTRLTAYGIGYELNLFSNFTFFLDDPVHGDQFRQADRRVVTGVKLAQRRLQRWAGRATQQAFGVQVRNDDVSNLGLFHTQARRWLATIRQDAVVETSVGAFVQNETEWTPRVRSVAGLRVDGYRFQVEAGDPANGGTRLQGIVSPKGGLVVGPFAGTELYANAGFGFHSNDARGTTMTRDPSTGHPAGAVTPLVRARGSEAGVRTVAIPHLQSSLSVWTLALDSELVFVGDAGTTDAGRPSRRYGIELANYYSPRPWLTVDGDLSWSHSRFTDANAAGAWIPGAVQTVVSGGVTVDELRRISGSVRLRYFGPRPLVEDDAVRSRATTLVNAQAGYRLTPSVKLALDVFNLLDARDSDVDYFYTSRLPGEPAAGVGDVHFHPALPRTARLKLVVAF